MIHALTSQRFDGMDHGHLGNFKQAATFLPPVLKVRLMPNSATGKARGGLARCALGRDGREGQIKNVLPLPNVRRTIQKLQMKKKGKESFLVFVV